MGESGGGADSVATLDGAVELDGGVFSIGHGVVTGVITFGGAAELDLSTEIPLSDPLAGTATIAGFGAGDKIDFLNVDYVNGDYVDFASNAGDTGGTLNVLNSSETAVASIEVIGSYLPYQFTLSADQQGNLVVGWADINSRTSTVDDDASISADWSRGADG